MFKFKFRPGTNRLKIKLGRHRVKNDDRQCKLCGAQCESVVHVLLCKIPLGIFRKTFRQFVEGGGELRKLCYFQ